MTDEGVAQIVNKRKGHKDTARSGMIVLATLILFCAGTANLYAYTYTYHNRTGYPIRVVVELYDEADKTIRIEANESKTILTQFLLKSWIAETFLDNTWKQALNLTCDFLPVDHTFSIYVKEVKDANGKTSYTWSAITDDIQRSK